MKTARIGTAVLVGLAAASFIRGVSGSETRVDEIESVEAVSAASESSGEITSDELIDLANTLCPVMGGNVMDGQYIDWEGYRIHFCCAGCDAVFLADPEKYLLILAEEPAVADLLGIECADCYPEDCSCEQAQPPCGGTCQ